MGLIVNIICMKFYKLTPEYMKEVRAELDRRKAEESAMNQSAEKVCAS